MTDEIIAYRREIDLYMSHAEEMLKVAEHNLDQGFYSTTVNRAYYAMFYAARALLSTKRLSRSKHSGVIAAFRQHFVKSGAIETEYSRTYGQLMDDRQDADYELETIIEAEQAKVDVGYAHRFVERVKQYLKKEGWL